MTSDWLLMYFGWSHGYLLSCMLTVDMGNYVMHAFIPLSACEENPQSPPSRRTSVVKLL